MDRPSDNLIARLEQSLRQSRAARMHLAARLRELEAEADTVRAELAEMDNLASQTEAAIYRLLSSVLASNNFTSGLPSDAELEAAMRQSTPQPRMPVLEPRMPIPVEVRHSPIASVHQPTTNARQPMPATRQPIPLVRDDIEAVSDRFMDRTIPQAVTLLLREEGGPLHVNEIYNRLLEGGFKFTGQNPTISIAVSLNRNSRFRKMAPGTFDLVMRDAKKVS
jgi:hypothetical protein